MAGRQPGNPGKWLMAEAGTPSIHIVIILILSHFNWFQSANTYRKENILINTGNQSQASL